MQDDYLDLGFEGGAEYDKGNKVLKKVDEDEVCGESVRIPDFVEEIGEYCFCKKVGENTYNGFEIESIDFGQGIKTIRQLALFDTKISKAELPCGMKYIGREAFRWCKKLEEVYIGGVKEIGYLAFSECTSLLKFEVYADLEKIGDECFENSSSLRQVTLPYSLKKIGKDAFKGCKISDVWICDNGIQHHYELCGIELTYEVFKQLKAEFRAKTNTEVLETLDELYTEITNAVSDEVKALKKEIASIASAQEANLEIAVSSETAELKSEIASIADAQAAKLKKAVSSETAELKKEIAAVNARLDGIESSMEVLLKELKRLRKSDKIMTFYELTEKELEEL
ncbi:leucine-rich repeat protein [uncultured Ruminococcus sp.]|uniref:leucine-rich repeat protein n=1 Tax=uncultured Ruminococcus sp. TaxID=165186 RepID=UPI000EE21B81|nr:leucine-rich repeat protein [uncultured Ruminococcus sp.]HCJ41414.1 hypothetical protein [Ruminococcus sp.]